MSRVTLRRNSKKFSKDELDSARATLKQFRAVGIGTKDENSVLKVAEIIKTTKLDVAALSKNHREYTDKHRLFELRMRELCRHYSGSTPRTGLKVKHLRLYINRYFSNASDSDKYNITKAEGYHRLQRCLSPINKKLLEVLYDTVLLSDK